MSHDLASCASSVAPARGRRAPPSLPAWRGALRPAAAPSARRARALAGHGLRRPGRSVACLVSEKYDGVRATWDGRCCAIAAAGRSRRRPPSSHACRRAARRRALARPRPLRRALGDRAHASRRAKTSGRRCATWCSRCPAPGTFAERADRLAAVVAARTRPRLECAPQRRLADRAALQRALDEVVARGGEGLMLHLASAPYVSGRSDALMKLKPHLDAEATVVGHRRGSGKYRRRRRARGRVADGRRFLVGSGLSDALRRDRRPIGAVITYRYRDLTRAACRASPPTCAATRRSERGARYRASTIADPLRSLVHDLDRQDLRLRSTSRRRRCRSPPAAPLPTTRSSVQPNRRAARISYRLQHPRCATPGRRPRRSALAPPTRPRQLQRSGAGTKPAI